ARFPPEIFRWLGEGSRRTGHPWVPRRVGGSDLVWCSCPGGVRWRLTRQGPEDPRPRPAANHLGSFNLDPPIERRTCTPINHTHSIARRIQADRSAIVAPELVASRLRSYS